MVVLICVACCSNVGNGHIMIKMEDCIDLNPGNNTQFYIGLIIKNYPGTNTFITFFQEQALGHLYHEFS